MHAKKSLGQNFLKSKAAIRSIVASGMIEKSDTVIEIGPGKGALTEILLETPAHIVAVEKDDQLVPMLTITFEKQMKTGRLDLIHGDILEMSVDRLVEKKPYKVIANIPYYITGMLFRKFLEEERQPEAMVLLVQKEVAQRIIARDGKESILSLSVKAYGTPRIVSTVSRKMFSPSPNVDSAILLVSAISKSFFTDFTEKEFFTWIRAGFSQKRKKLIRNLEKVSPREKLERLFDELSINNNTRAEDLTLTEWRKLLTSASHDH